MITRFYDLGLVWIRMTPTERAEYRKAHLMAWIKFWRTPAELMSEELEAIICGHRPERYVLLRDWSG